MYLTNFYLTIKWEISMTTLQTQQYPKNSNEDEENI